METKKDAYIKQIEITDFLEKGQNLCLPLNKDVMVLAGDNGTGKTALLKMIDASLNKNETPYEIRGLYSSVKLVCSDDEYTDVYKPPESKYTPHYLRFIDSNDIDCEESSVIYKTENEYLDNYVQVVSDFLSNYGIELRLTQNNSSIRGYVDAYKNGRRIPLNHLSDGQRRFIKIMFMALDPPTHRAPLLLIDTPETFLHSSAQKIIIESIQKINPNIQLLITTHSPGILMNGGLNWIVNMSEILTKAEC